MLTQIITQMLQAAKETGAVQRRKLKNDLHITIIQQTTHWTLILRRDNIYPSEQEWQTVLRHWPYEVGQVQPEKRFVRSAYTLRGSVPTKSIQMSIFE